jgi:predicted exporter
VIDRTQLRAAIATFDPTSVVYLDVKEESNGLVSAYRHRTVMLAGLGIVFIGVLLLLDMRNPVKVLRVLLPIGCAILVVSACLHALGERLSLFHIASFLLVVGLGLDYALFFNRRHGTEMERDRTIYGLLVCSTTTILVFGILMTSHVPILRAIGLTAGLGSLCCMLFGAILAERTSLGSSIR